MDHSVLQCLGHIASSGGCIGLQHVVGSLNDPLPVGQRLQLQGVTNFVGHEQAVAAVGGAAPLQLERLVTGNAYPAIGVLRAAQRIGSTIQSIAIAEVVDVKGFPAFVATDAAAGGTDGPDLADSGRRARR